MEVFQTNVRCRRCGQLFCAATHGSDFYNSFPKFVCGRCGSHGFYDSIERWVPASVWFNPFTWGKGAWQTNTEVVLSQRTALLEAAQIIEHNAESLQQSEQNPRTGEVDDTEVAQQIHHELFLASKLREYAS